MSETKEYHIFRYNNRKLYLKEESRYTTLKEIKELYLSGAKLNIFKHNVNAPVSDITQETIVSALTWDVESKKKVFTFFSTFLTKGNLL